jgi:hypothetical protein
MKLAISHYQLPITNYQVTNEKGDLLAVSTGAIALAKKS